MEKMTPHFKVTFKNVLKAHWLSSKIQVLNIFMDLCAVDLSLLYALEVRGVNTSCLGRSQKVSKRTVHFYEV